MVNDYLFVYGKLRMTNSNKHAQYLHQNSRYVQTGCFKGKLYDAGHYPGAVPAEHPEFKVHGEIYKLTDPVKVFMALDLYEECAEHFPEPHEYKRQLVQVTLDSGDKLTAHAYIYNHDITNLTPIPSGDYLAYKTVNSE